jgi:hypothetical protein
MIENSNIRVSGRPVTASSLSIVLSLILILAQASDCQGRGFPLGAATAVVRNEEGEPMSGVTVKYAFVVPDGVYNVKVTSVTAATSENGQAYAEGRCDSMLGFGCMAEGYYESGGSVSFTGRSGDRWEPWNSKVPVVMRKRVNPIPLYVRAGQIITIPVLNEAVGFDMEKGDWVAPHGKGVHADMLFKGRRSYVDRSNFEAEVDVMFARPEDGIQEVPVLRGSALKVAHLAPESGYKPVLKKWNRMKLEKGGDSNVVVENGPCFVFRTRTVTREDGTIIRANYGKIHGDIHVNPIGVPTIAMQFTYYFNPNVNDRNLEFDTKRNLAGDSTFPTRDP